MASPAYIVKRHGERASEEFDADKLHRSIIAACLSVRTPIGEAEMIARDVCLSVIHWCSEKGEVTSDDLRRMSARTLQLFHPEAAYLYQHHQLIL